MAKALVGIFTAPGSFIEKSRVASSSASKMLTLRFRCDHIDLP